MKRINNFSKYNLIAESIIYFSDDFNSILNSIRDEANYNREYDVADLAAFLQHVCGKDSNLSQNYVNVADNGLVKYIMDNRINYDDVQVDYDYMFDIKHIQGYLPMSKGKSLLGLDYIKQDDIQKYKNSFKLLETLEGWEHYIFLLQLNEEGNKNEAKSYPMTRARDIKYEEKKKHILLYKKINSFNQKPFTPKLPKNFSEVRLGRFINKTMQEFGYNRFDNSTIEKFVNYYKSIFIFNRDAHKNFHIVSGKDIKYYYNEDTYEYKKGQLGASCMRTKGCQNYLSIYTENPEVCKMLVLTGEKEDSGKLGKKIIGRALLWTLTDGSLYMDRIYTNNDAAIKIFEKWAKDNNYKNYVYNNPDLLSVKIKAKDYGKYPYMDTFEFYLIQKGILVNNDDFTKLLDLPNVKPESSFGRKALTFIKTFGSKKQSPEVLRLKSTSGHGTNTGWILDHSVSRGYRYRRGG